MTPDDDDRRDERLAELLEVPPLDDVTRRRLVRRALDEPGATPARGRGAPGRSSPPRPRWSSVSSRPRSCSATTVATRRRRTATAPRRPTRPRRAQPTRRRRRARRRLELGDIGEISDPAVAAASGWRQPRRRPRQPSTERRSPLTSLPLRVHGPSSSGIDGPFSLLGHRHLRGRTRRSCSSPRRTASTPPSSSTDACEVRSEVPLV